MFPFDELHHGVNKMVNALRLLIHKEAPAPYEFICKWWDVQPKLH